MNLAAEMGKLPEPPNDSAPPHWDYWRHQLWELAQQDDPKNFMRWPCIYHTMLQDHWRESIGVEVNRIPGAIVDLLMGNAWRDANQQSSFYSLIHQAYHILRWQKVTGLRIADMQSIFEFGGGYGAMALVCNRLGFRGEYRIYDLPEFSLLQRWYLGQCGLDNVEWLDTLKNINVDLLIACYSLSETTIDEREYALYLARAKSYLMLYSAKWESYDNQKYFEGLEGKHWTPQNWRHERIEHLPPESWYTWGW